MMTSTVSELDASPIPFLHLMELLKALPRTGWLRWMEHPESVADHSFRVAVLGLFAPPGVDPLKCILLGLAHDMAEAIVGDIAPHQRVSKEEKFKLEDNGFRYLESLVRPFSAGAAIRLRAAFDEYEAGETPEAKFVQDADKFECLLQAFEYEQRTRGTKDLTEFQGLDPKITDPTCRNWVSQLNKERDMYHTRRRSQVPVIFLLGAPSVELEERLLDNMTRFRYTSLLELLRRKSQDPTYLHADYLRGCLEEKVEPPVELIIALIESCLDDCQLHKQILLLHGFPETSQQLSRFEDRIHTIHYTLCYDEFVITDELRSRLVSTNGHFESINGDGSAEVVSQRVLECAQKFIQPAGTSAAARES